MDILSDKSDKIVYLFMSCNESWVTHLSVVINSAKKHTSRHLHLFFCAKSIEQERYFYEKLIRLTSPHFSFEIIVPNHFFIQKTFGNKILSFPIECYHRLFVGSLVPLNIKKVIYLDCDIIVNADLGILYDLPISTTIAAAEDIYGKIYCPKLLLRDFGIKVDTYINNGVLLINLNKYRTKHIEENMVSILLKMNTNLSKTVDQDLFNLLFLDDITFLETSWNVQVLYGVVPKDIKSVYIYHIYGYLKADSPFYYNRTIRSLYLHYSNQNSGSYIFYDIIYFFIVFPLKKFLYVKTKLYFKSTFSSKKDLLGILWIFYPPVTIIMVIQTYKSIKKIGIKKFIVKLLQLFGLDSKPIL